MYAWLVGLLETLEAIFGRQRFCTCVVCWGRSNLAELLGMGNGQNTFPQFGFFYGSENEPPSRFDDKLESRLILAKPLTGLARTLRGVTPPTAVDENCILSGKCPEEDHSLLEQTASFMGFNSFRDVFDTYLALDITAFADLMQVFRLHFFETHHLDPFLHPTLPSAAWDAALRHITRHSGERFRLITDMTIYRDIKKAMMGGVCAVFGPRCEANFEGMEGYDSEKPTKNAYYLDVNSMCPDAMTKFLPSSEGAAVALPEGEEESLKWLHDVIDCLNPLEDGSQDIHLVFVDYDFPEDLHDGIDWPSPCRMAVPIEEVGPYTKDAVRGRKPAEKLVPFLGRHQCEGIHAKRLASLRNHLGARIWKAGSQSLPL